MNLIHQLKQAKNRQEKEILIKKALKDPLESVRVEAVKNIGLIDSFEERETLIKKALEDESKIVKLISLDKIGFIDSSEERKIFIERALNDSWEEIREKAICRSSCVFSQLDKKALIIKALEDESETVRAAAICQVQNLNGTAELIKKALEDESEKVRVSAIYQVKTSDFAEELIKKALEDESEKVRKIAISHFSLIKNNILLKHLISKFFVKFPEEIASQLSLLKNPGSMIVKLWDTGVTEKKILIKYFSLIKNNILLKELVVKALNDESEEVQKTMLNKIAKSK